MERLKFSKKSRLLKNGQFRRVLNRRVTATNELLTIFACENGLGYPRVGISISSSIPLASCRNRLKRLIREAWRLNQKQIPAGCDYVVMASARFLKNAELEGAKQVVKKLTFLQVEKALTELIKDIGQSGRLKVE